MKGPTHRLQKVLLILLGGGVLALSGLICTCALPRISTYSLPWVRPGQLRDDRITFSAIFEDLKLPGRDATFAQSSYATFTSSTSHLMLAACLKTELAAALEARRGVLWRINPEGSYAPGRQLVNIAWRALPPQEAVAWLRTPSPRSPFADAVAARVAEGTQDQVSGFFATFSGVAPAAYRKAIKPSGFLALLAGPRVDLTVKGGLPWKDQSWVLVYELDTRDVLLVGTTQAFNGSWIEAKEISPEARKSHR